MIDLSFLWRKTQGEVSKVRKASSLFSFKDGNLPDLELSQAATRPCDSELTSRLQSKLREGTYKVKIKKGVKRFTVFRFLLAKMLYEEEGLHLDEYLVLYELYYDFREMKDPTFQAKYEEWFRETEIFFIYLARLAVFPYRIPQQAQWKVIQHLGTVLPTQSAYFGLKGNRDLRNSFQLQFDHPLDLRSARVQRFVGVGYKDKGNCREVAIDGTPDWKETAGFYSSLERLYEDFLGESLKTYRSGDFPREEN